jgi:phosphatidate cytidylyltransferase
LNRPELIRRSITGIFIVLFTLAAVYLSPFTLLLFLCLIHAGAMGEYFRLNSVPRSVHYYLVIPLCLTSWLVFSGYYGYGIRDWLLSMLFLPVVMLLMVIIIIFFKKKQTDQNVPFIPIAFSAVAYITIPLWTGLIFVKDPYEYQWVLIPIVLVWLNDVGAYLVGSKWGRKKIASGISPGKTVEGTFGGCVFSLLTAWGLTYVWPEIPVIYIGYLGILVPVFALAGDLYESSLKRKAGVKDSGNLLPGHGGILDRYDSLLFVLPVAAFGYYIFAP